MIVSIEHSKTHSMYKYNNYIQQLYITVSNIYSRQINSINLHTSSFDNASHDDKPSRISHNSITLCHELQVMFNWHFSLTLPSRWLVSKYQSLFDNSYLQER